MAAAFAMAGSSWTTLACKLGMDFVAKSEFQLKLDLGDRQELVHMITYAAQLVFPWQFHRPVGHPNRCP